MENTIQKERINNEWVRLHLPSIEEMKKKQKPSRTWLAAQKHKGAIVVYDQSLFED